MNSDYKEKSKKKRSHLIFITKEPHHTKTSQIANAPSKEPGKSPIIRKKKESVYRIRSSYQRYWVLLITELLPWKMPKPPKNQKQNK
jgi:hypothetical protein